MKARGYSQYRGRKSWLHYVLAALAVILALALIVAVLALLFFPDRVREVLSLPQSAASAPPLPSDALDDILVVEPSATPSPTPLPTPAPSMSPRRDTPMGLVSTTPEALRSGDAPGALKAQQGAVTAMKPASGRLPFLLNGAPAAVSAEDVTLAEQYRAANAALDYSAAYVSCFLDEAVAAENPALTLKAPGALTPWLDEAGHAWLDPANEEVQRYLIALCQELAGLGFDEIILDNAGYPDGELAQPEVLSGFYAALSAALSDLGYNGRLSVIATKDVFEKSVDAATGQSLSAVAQCFERVYLSGSIRWSSGTNVYRLLQNADFQGTTRDVVTVTTKPISASYAWAVLPQD